MTVRCSAACDLRVTGGASAVTRSLPRAGVARVKLDRLQPDGRMVVRAQATAPDGEAVRSRRAVSVDRRRLALPVPHLLDVRAHRSAGKVVVTFRTDIPARRTQFIAVLSRTRRISLGADVAFGQRTGGGRLRHRLIVRADHGPPGSVAGARFVRVYTRSLDRDSERPPVIVRIR